MAAPVCLSVCLPGPSTTTPAVLTTMPTGYLRSPYSTSLSASLLSPGSSCTPRSVNSCVVPPPLPWPQRARARPACGAVGRWWVLLARQSLAVPTVERDVAGFPAAALLDTCSFILLLFFSLPQSPSWIIPLACFLPSLSIFLLSSSFDLPNSLSRFPSYPHSYCPFLLT